MAIHRGCIPLFPAEHQQVLPTSGTAIHSSQSTIICSSLGEGIPSRSLKGFGFRVAGNTHHHGIRMLDCWPNTEASNGNDHGT